MRPGDRIRRVTGWRYWWAWLNKARFSWIWWVVTLVVVDAVLRWLGWR